MPDSSSGGVTPFPHGEVDRALGSNDTALSEQKRLKIQGAHYCEGELSTVQHFCTQGEVRFSAEYRNAAADTLSRNQGYPPDDDLFGDYSSTQSSESSQDANCPVLKLFDLTDNMVATRNTLFETPEDVSDNIKQLEAQLTDVQTRLKKGVPERPLLQQWPSPRVIAQMLITSIALHLCKKFTSAKDLQAVEILLQAMSSEDSILMLSHIVKEKSAFCVNGYVSTEIKSMHMSAEKYDTVVKFMKHCANKCGDCKQSRVLSFVTVALLIYEFAQYWRDKVQESKLRAFDQNVAAACMSALLAFPDKWKTWGVKNIKKAEMKDIAEMFLPVMQEVLDFVHEKEPWSIMTLDAFLGHGKPDYAKSADHLRMLLTVQPQVPHRLLQCMLTLHMEKKQRTPEDAASAGPSRQPKKRSAKAILAAMSHPYAK
jgi:hypothetical protein